jgi:hypothetical protein
MTSRKSIYRGCPSIYGGVNIFPPRKIDLPRRTFYLQGVYNCPPRKIDLRRRLTWPSPLEAHLGSKLRSQYITQTKAPKSTHSSLPNLSPLRRSKTQRRTTLFSLSLPPSPLSSHGDEGLALGARALRQAS